MQVKVYRHPNDQFKFHKVDLGLRTIVYAPAMYLKFKFHKVDLGLEKFFCISSQITKFKFHKVDLGRDECDRERSLYYPV